MPLRTLCLLSFLVSFFTPTSSTIATKTTNPFSQPPPLFHTNRTGDSEKCIQLDPCMCVRDNIDVINLHFLDNGTKPRFNLTISDYLLQWNPCTGFTAQGTDGVALTLKSIDQYVSILGFANDAKIGIWNGFNVISYKKVMTKYSWRIVLQCNTDLEGKLSGNNFDKQNNTMNVIYTGPCTERPASSIAGKIIIAIVLVIFFSITGLAVYYCIVSLRRNRYERM